MRPNVNDEDGASLILIIIFVMIFSVVIAAVLDFASTGFKTTESVVEIRNMQQAVDGAMEGAINALRGSNAFGANGAPVQCPDFKYDSDDDADPAVVVTCTPDATSSNGAPGALIPKYAILTGLWKDPTSTCKGFLQNGGGAGNEKQITVRGGIFSNGRIAINDFETGSGCTNLGGASYMNVFGDALAVGKCTWWTTPNKLEPKIVSNGGKRACSGHTDAPTAPGEDVPPYEPNRASAAAVATAGSGYDPLPVCNPSGVDVDAKFLPGVYTEVPTYHFARAGCSGDIWWFSPGTYYFDFPSTPSGRDEWTVFPNNIIGGTLKTPGSVRSSWGSSDHKACQDDPKTTSPGVQFIFGGPSRLTTRSDNNGNGGVIDLCAGAAPDSAVKQRLVVYALQPATAKPAQNTRPAAVTNESFENKTAPTGTFDSPGNAKSPDSSYATKNFTFGDGPSTVVFSDFADIPEGSTVTSVKAEIRHSLSGLFPAKLAESITFKYDSNSTTGTKVNMGTCTVSVVSGDTVDTCTLNFLQDPFRWREINSLSATYTVDPSGLKNPEVCTGQGQNMVCTNVPETATASLNSVRLIVNYQAPGFEGQVCSCDFLTTTSNPQTFFEGTFFAPYADLAIIIHNGGFTEFARGLIASSIKGTASASMTQTVPPFKLPGLLDRRVVHFEAWVGGEVRLRATVSYDDVENLQGRSVEILDWAVVRS